MPTLCYVMLDAFFLVAYTDLFAFFVRVVCLLCADVSVVISLGFFSLLLSIPCWLDFYDIGDIAESCQTK